MSGKERKILDDIKYGLVLGSEEFVKWIGRKFANQRFRPEQLPLERKLAGDRIKEGVLDGLIKEFNIKRAKLVK